MSKYGNRRDENLEEFPKKGEEDLGRFLHTIESKRVNPAFA